MAFGGTLTAGFACRLSNKEKAQQINNLLR